MSHPPPLLRLDPFRPQPVPSAPVGEEGPQADHVDERLVHHKTARGEAAVIGVEVPVNGNAALLCKGDRFADLAPLEVALPRGNGGCPGVQRLFGQSGR